MSVGALIRETVISDEPLSYWPLDTVFTSFPVSVEAVVGQPTAVYRDVCGEAHGVLHDNEV